MSQLAAWQAESTAVGKYGPGEGAGSYILICRPKGRGERKLAWLRF